MQKMVTRCSILHNKALQKSCSLHLTNPGKNQYLTTDLLTYYADGIFAVIFLLSLWTNRRLTLDAINAVFLMLCELALLVIVLTCFVLCRMYTMLV